MIYKIAGGIAFILIALPLIGLTTVPAIITGIAALVAGIALLAGR